jgi:hypothetical protein
MLKDWDLNLWFKENVVDDVVVREDVITINPAIYIADGEDIYGTVRKVYTGILYKCDALETAKIRAFRSEQEYGDDWWDFRQDLYALEISQGIQDFLNDLPDPYSIDIEDTDDLYHIDSIDKLHSLVG